MSLAVEIVEVHRRPTLRGVSMAAPARGITAVVDPSRSRGALLFRMVAGLEPVDDGAVIVLGKDITRARSRDRRRLLSRVAFVFGGPEFALFANATVRDNVSFFVRSAGRAGRRQGSAVAEEVIELLDLADVADATPDRLNPVQRKRLALARALALRSPLVVADAFDDATEAREVERLAATVREEQCRRGSAAVLFMADGDLAARVADDVIELPTMQGSAGRVRFPIRCREL
jgi:ABC-type polar amino acid transport system ATPase subunit